MKDQRNSDISEFFVRNTENYEVEPPEYIWKNIEKSLPAQPNGFVSFIKNNTTFLVVFVGTLLTGILILFYIINSQQKEDFPNIAQNANIHILPHYDKITNNMNNEVSSSIKKEETSDLKTDNKEVPSTSQKEEKIAEETKSVTPDDIGTSEELQNKHETTNQEKLEVNKKEEEIAEQLETNEKINKKKIWNLNLSSFKKITKILVYNTTGKEVISEKITRKVEGMYPLDISKLNKGVYVVKIETEGKLIELTTIKVD